MYTVFELHSPKCSSNKFYIKNSTFKSKKTDSDIYGFCSTAYQKIKIYSKISGTPFNRKYNFIANLTIDGILGMEYQIKSFI